MATIANRYFALHVYAHIKQIGDCPICALYGLNEEVGGSVGSESPDSSSDLIIVATYLLSVINGDLGNDTVNSSVSEVSINMHKVCLVILRSFTVFKNK